MNRFKELEGAWEERGVIGSRIEIARDRLTVLWRSAPVLETVFTAEEREDGAVLLHLRETGMRYAGAASDYAQVSALRLENGKLIFEEDFPITGKSTQALERTERSRFGDYSFADRKILPLLRGTWVTEDGFHTLKFSGATVEKDGVKRKIRVLESPATPGEYKIADADPAREVLFGLMDYRFTGRELTAIVPVCDAPSVQIRFFKKSKK